MKTAPASSRPVRRGGWTGLGIVFSTGAGLVIGVLVDHLVLGMGVGGGVGLILGAVTEGAVDLPSPPAPPSC